MLMTLQYKAQVQQKRIHRYRSLYLVVDCSLPTPQLTRLLRYTGLSLSRVGRTSVLCFTCLCVCVCVYKNKTQYFRSICVLKCQHQCVISCIPDSVPYSSNICVHVWRCFYITCYHMLLHCYHVCVHLSLQIDTEAYYTYPFEVILWNHC